MSPTVPPAPPATPPKQTDWTAVLTSKTFLGTLLGTVVPIILAWINGNPPTLTQGITAAGIVLGAAGLRDILGRIETYAAAVQSGLSGANIPPVK
jgi:hypothetical protein